MIYNRCGNNFKKIINLNFKKMTNCVELTDLSNDELMVVEGGVLPLLAIPVLIKGIGLGFAAAAAVYGMIALGNQMD
jgi:uncharacterized membrane-anchored protein